MIRGWWCLKRCMYNNVRRVIASTYKHIHSRSTHTALRWKSYSDHTTNTHHGNWEVSGNYLRRGRCKSQSALVTKMCFLYKRSNFGSVTPWRRPLWGANCVSISISKICGKMWDPLSFYLGSRERFICWRFHRKRWMENSITYTSVKVQWSQCVHCWCWNRLYRVCEV